MTLTDREIFDFANQPRSVRARRIINIPGLSEEILVEPSNPAQLAPARGGPISDSDDFDEDDEDNGSVYEEPSASQDLTLFSRHRAAYQNMTQAMEGEDSVHATIAPPSKPRRGRRPTHLSAASRSARDIARKTNHSRIEKRRREKINDVLDALRGLIPPPSTGVDSREGGDETEAEEDEEDGGPKGRKRKKSNSADSKATKKGGEFKLDVLERTLAFVRHLLSTIESLEAEKREWLKGVSSAPGPISESSIDAPVCTEHGQDSLVTETPRSPQRPEGLPPTSPISSTPQVASKRKRNTSLPDSPAIGSTLPPAETTSRQVSGSRRTSASPRVFASPDACRTKLPSISSLLNSSDETPVFQLPSPPSPYAFEVHSGTPSLRRSRDPVIVRRASAHILPSPDTSQVDPTSPFPFMTLASPSIPFMSQPYSTTSSSSATLPPSHSSQSGTQKPSETRANRPPTHDDETAAIASVLMQFSTRKKSLSTSPTLTPADHSQTHPQTPSSILGL